MKNSIDEISACILNAKLQKDAWCRTSCFRGKCLIMYDVAVSIKVGNRVYFGKKIKIISAYKTKNASSKFFANRNNSS